MKINKKSIVSALSILAVMALGVITIPANAEARFNTGYQNRTNLVHTPSPAQSNSQDPQPTPTVYSSSTNPNQTRTAPANTVTKTTTKKAAAASVEEPEEDPSDLAANAVFGTNSFMPSGLIQWILFAILILLIVILVRKVTGAEDKYHSEPLKHA